MRIQIGYFKLYLLKILKTKNSTNASIIFSHAYHLYLFSFLFYFYSKVRTIWLVIFDWQIKEYLTLVKFMPIFK